MQKKNAEFYKKNYGEVHQPSLTEMEELRKFQSSTFDTLTRQKFIEDQNTIMELSGRLQELQNEVNCMNDSKDFQDAESVSSGNSHVTSQPGVFPKHPPFVEASLRIAATNRWAAKYLGYIRYIKKHFCPSHVYSGEKWKTRTRSRSEMPVDRQPKIQSSSVEETLQRIMGQTNNDCRFQISILTSSLHQPRLLAGRCGSRPRYVLVHNFLRKRCNGSRMWSWLIQWMN